MLVDLVRVTAADGVRLDGVLSAPANELSAASLADAFLFLHGTGSNFYGSSLLEGLARWAVDMGAAALVVNTRGHDLLSATATSAGPRQLGAAMEVVDDCRHDIAAWLGFLEGLGRRRIVLVGHSLGAIKAIFTQAHERRPSVVALVAISPARLSASYFLSTPQAGLFRETLAAAEAHVREGRPQTLMSVQFPLPYVVSAAGYIDKYGPEERYNILKYVGRLACPTLVTFGSLEVQSNVAFAGLPEAICAQVSSGQPLTVATIAGGDHVYSGVRSELTARIEMWLRRTLRETKGRSEAGL